MAKNYKINELLISANKLDNNFKSPKLFANKDILIIAKLSKELQDYIYAHNEQGQIAILTTPMGLAVDKQELTDLLSLEDTTISNIENYDKVNDDPANNFFYREIGTLRECGAKTHELPTSTGSNGRKYVDLRQILKKPIAQISKFLNCNTTIIQKQLEPILKAQFLKLKKIKENKKENEKRRKND